MPPILCGFLCLPSQCLPTLLQWMFFCGKGGGVWKRVGQRLSSLWLLRLGNVHKFCQTLRAQCIPTLIVLHVDLIWNAYTSSTARGCAGSFKGKIDINQKKHVPIEFNCDLLKSSHSMSTSHSISHATLFCWWLQQGSLEEVHSCRTTKYYSVLQNTTRYYKVLLRTTSSTAQGGGGSFKNRKPIGEIGCCESPMAEQKRWWIELSNCETEQLTNWLSDWLRVS